jgi:hypothetical protein
MTPATRLFPSEQAASDIDRILEGEKPLPFQHLFLRRRLGSERPTGTHEVVMVRFTPNRDIRLSVIDVR